MDVKTDGVRAIKKAMIARGQGRSCVIQ